MEEACSMGFSGGFEQGKPETALPELRRFIPVNVKKVNPQNKSVAVERLEYNMILHNASP